MAVGVVGLTRVGAELAAGGAAGGQSGEGLLEAVAVHAPGLVDTGGLAGEGEVAGGGALAQLGGEEVHARTREGGRAAGDADGADAGLDGEVEDDFAHEGPEVEVLVRVEVAHL